MLNANFGYNLSHNLKNNDKYSNVYNRKSTLDSLVQCEIKKPAMTPVKKDVGQIFPIQISHDLLKVC